jgi:hypothetical protein
LIPRASSEAEGLPRYSGVERARAFRVRLGAI